MFSPVFCEFSAMEARRNFVATNILPIPSKNSKIEYPFGCKPTVETTQIYSKKRPFPHSNSPENLFWWRKVSACKTKPSSTDKIKKNPLLKTNPITETPNKNGAITTYKGDGERVKEKLAVFRAKCEELSRIPVEERGTHRIDFKAVEELTKQGKLPKKVSVVLGSIPGVEVGDRFLYRVELMIVGLHSRNQHEIVFLLTRGRKLVATCIVSTEGYLDQIEGTEALTYVGEGGMYGSLKDGSCHTDQKMERGNLALKNSIEVGNDVRFVKGVRFRTRFGNSGLKTTYVYDGLYKVVGYEKKRGLLGHVLFEFKLKRNPGQPMVPWRVFK